MCVFVLILMPKIKDVVCSAYRITEYPSIGKEGAPRPTSKVTTTTAQ